MPHLELRNVEKRYTNNAEAVRGVSFSAEQGEFIVLVGPSGCGKSTTLRLVAGLESTTGGDIMIAGKRVNDFEPKDRDVAMVFQNYALYPHLTVAENIAFPLTIRKEDKAIIEREVRQAAELLSITALLDRKPKELSGGERQRVAVGRAIVRKPQVFLFDEPLSNLDAALRAGMRAELKTLQKRLGVTMLYVTHDQTEAMTMGDKIAVLNGGKLEQYGTPDEIYQRPSTSFVAKFLGSPPMNLLQGRMEGSVFTAAGVSINLGLSAPGRKELQVGIRPEDFAVATTSASIESTNSTVEGRLVLTEPLGATTNYIIESSASISGRIVISRHGFDPAESSELGSTLRFTVRPNTVHLFDTETGKRI
jgi:ABC-type sugar transport system ATPase subunit